MDYRLREWLFEFKQSKKKLAFALIFFLIAVVVYITSGDYVTDRASSVVSHDLILDHIGPYNLSILYVGLSTIVIALVFLYPLISKPREFPYVLVMFSLFLIVRSGFIIFTHLRTPTGAIIVAFPGILRFFNFSNDLFFSGHTGLPFLGFLIFKNHKKISYFMLVSSIIMGIIVLLMHVHYSIDVLSAFFITYGVYKIGNYLNLGFE